MQNKGLLKKIIIAIIIIIVVIVGVSLYFIIKRSQETATVDILVAPISAEISIDGKKYENGAYSIVPGNHDVVISKDGFKTETMNFEVADGEEFLLRSYLEQLDGDDWYKNNEADAMIRGAIMASRSEKAIQELSENNPIISDLPIYVDYFTNNYAKHVKYTISYQMIENNTKIKIIITDYTGDNYDKAILNLSNRGYNISNYEVEYSDNSENFKVYRAS